RNAGAPPSIGSIANQPSRPRTPQKPMSSVHGLSSPNDTSGFRPVVTEISVPFPIFRPIIRNQGRVYIDAYSGNSSVLELCLSSSPNHRAQPTGEGSSYQPGCTS